MNRCFPLVLVGLLFCLPRWVAAGAAGALGDEREPPPRPNEELLINQVVPDIRLLTPQGPLQLSKLWQDRPLLLTLVYTRCAGICVPFLRSLQAAADRDAGAGRDYDIVVVSFDPRDTLADLEEAAEELHVHRQPGWTFATAAPADVERLSKAVMFWTRWDPASQQYDHPGLLLAIVHGHILRVLTGASVHPARFREMVAELRGRFVPSYPLPNPRIPFRCFQYRADGSFRLDWGALLLLVPGTTALGLTAWLFGFGSGRR